MSTLLTLKNFFSPATVDVWLKLVKLRPIKCTTFQETHLEKAKYIFL